MGAPDFIYHSFRFQRSFSGLRAGFRFTCGEHIFTPTVLISDVTEDMIGKMGREQVEEWIFQLGLAEIPTYWKAFCSPTIVIKCGFLDDSQIRFWQKLIRKGMGEFFYVNNKEPFEPAFEIHTDEIVGSAASLFQSLGTTNEKKVLVPVGGGKDSIVSLELLAENDMHITTISGHLGASANVIKLFRQRHPESHVQDIVFTREVDVHLLKLNHDGYPNGHTPFSSVLAFLTTFTAELFEIPFVAVSNEGSANEPTAIWHGIDVNHQYSKSFEFEQDFQQYIRGVSRGVPTYFSLLRPLSELTIAKIFVQYPEYFPIFRSCNVGQKTNTWCGHCPKCIFVALLLSAYIDDKTITTIYGYPILENSELVPLVDQLVGIAEYKPFECVGTREDSKRALTLAIKRRAGKTLPGLLSHYETFVLDQTIEKQTEDLSESALPKEFENILLNSRI